MGRLITRLCIVSLLPLILYTTIPILSLGMPVENSTTDSSISQPNITLFRRQYGNANAAGDLYGLGLRVGAYLQVFGMLLSCVRSENRSRAGIFLVSSSVCLSLFFAVTIIVAHYAISPCEAWLILSLTAAYGVPRFCAVNETDKPKAGIATVCCLVSLFWQQILYFWFWTTLCRQLPLLGTANQVWFFGRVDVSGWFRIFMLVATCLDSIMTAASIAPYLNLIAIRFVYWTGAELEDSPLEREAKPSANLWDRTLFWAGKCVDSWRNKYLKYLNFGPYLVSLLFRLFRRCKRILTRRDHDAIIEAGSQKTITAVPDGPGAELQVVADASQILNDPDADLKALEAAQQALASASENLRAKADTLDKRADLLDRELRIWKLFMLFKGFAVLVLTIIGVEKIIEYNSLSATSDLSTPGQIIPFILGIITFIVGASHAIKPNLPTSPTSKTTSPIEWIHLAWEKVRVRRMSKVSIVQKD